MITLLKINLRGLFSRMFMRSRSGKKRKPVFTVLIVLLVVYVVGALFMGAGITFHQLAKALFVTEYGWLYFSMMGIVVFSFCFVGSIFAAQAQIFNAKDNDLLLSLPINPSSILLGRLFSLLMLNYLFEAFIVIPAFVIWCVTQSVTIVGVIFFFIAALVLPLSALALACFFAWLVALITSRMRNTKILTLILSLLFFGAYFLVISNIQKYILALISNGEGIAAVIQKTLFPIYHLGNAIDSGNAVSMLIFVICTVAPFVIALLILSVNFIRIVTTNRGAVKIQYTEKTLKVSSIRNAFVIKELRHFLSNPMYILNSSLGALLMLVLAVVLVIKSELILGYISKLTGAGINISSAILVCLMLSAIASLNVVSAPTISLEGKNLWIAKSLPVKPFDVLIAKAEMHLLVCGTPAVISAVICALALGATPVEFVFLLLVPLCFTALMALAGVVINLQFPKFDWINEIQPIKQGLSTLLTMFGAVSLIALLVVIYVFPLSNVMSIEMYLGLVIIFLVAVSAGLFRYLGAGGSRRFFELNND